MTRTARSACSTRTVRTAAPRWCSRATRSAGCAASTTAGRSTSTGRVLETPPEPDELNFKDKVRAIAYPMHESGGFVWAYMGPPGTEPPAPRLRVHGRAAEPPRDHDRARGVATGCRCIEGVIDSAHSNYLHSKAIKPATGDADDRLQGQTRRRSRSALQRRRAAHRSAGHRVRLPLRGDPQPDGRRRHATATFA